jgi:hypothetical protein
MSLQNKYTDGNEREATCERRAKKRKALAYLDKTIKLAKHAHEDKRTKAEAKFRRNPLWTYRIKNGKAYTETVDIYKWKEVRESKSTPKRDGRVWSCAYRDQWLCVRERRCLKKRHPLWTHLELRRTVGEADVLDSQAFVIS